MGGKKFTGYRTFNIGKRDTNYWGRRGESCEGQTRYLGRVLCFQPGAQCPGGPALVSGPRGGRAGDSTG